MNSLANQVFTLGVVTLPLVAQAMPDLPYLRMHDLKGVKNPEKAQWKSVDKDWDFLPADELPKIKKPANSIEESRKLANDYDGSSAGAWEEYNPYSVQPFVEGMSEYDEYQQAWRMLGFMIDCNAPADENDEDDHHSGSQDTTDEGCARYVLWAAYVDTEYEGAGIAEYQYYNATTGKWDNSACQYAEGGNSRCAKMDCHLENTHFSLLGFFKHRNYDDWMEQLFKHEGMCVWSDEEYAFMKNARKAWPGGCTDSGSYAPDGSTLYYDIKPMSHGRIAIGLYTDSKCIVDYSSSTDEVEAILGNFFANGGGSHDSGDANYDFSGDSLSESMDRWNSAFDVWQTCHPCTAYDIENTDGTKYYQNYYYYNGNYYYYDNNNRDLGGEYNAQGEAFECYDDAGYTNVNQCMKFSAKTTMHTATFRDMSLGRTQGTLVESPLAGYYNSQSVYRSKIFGNFLTYFFFVTTSLALCYSAYMFRKVRAETNFELKEALVVKGGTSEIA